MSFSHWSEMSACRKHKYLLMPFLFNTMNVKIMARLCFLIIGSFLMCFLQMLVPCSMYKTEQNMTERTLKFYAMPFDI